MCHCCGADVLDLMGGNNLVYSPARTSRVPYMCDTVAEIIFQPLGDTLYTIFWG